MLAGGVVLVQFGHDINACLTGMQLAPFTLPPAMSTAVPLAQS